MFVWLHFKRFYRRFKKSKNIGRKMPDYVTIWRNVNVASFFAPDNGTYLWFRILILPLQHCPSWRSILAELILHIALTAGQYGKVLPSRLSTTGDLNFNIIIFSNWEWNIKNLSELHGKMNINKVIRSEHGMELELVLEALVIEILLGKTNPKFSIISVSTLSDLGS